MVKFQFVLLFGFVIFGSCGSGSHENTKDNKTLQKGAELYTRYGCIVCHSLEGKEIYGPALNNIYLKEVVVLRDGKEIKLTADRGYIKKAISDPRFEKVKKYHNKEMPLSFIPEKEVEMLVDFIIALNKIN